MCRSADGDNEAAILNDEASGAVCQDSARDSGACEHGAAMCGNAAVNFVAAVDDAECGAAAKPGGVRVNQAAEDRVVAALMVLNAEWLQSLGGVESRAEHSPR